MVFSSSVFLFLFLPVALALTFAGRKGLRNVCLLAASLVFYAWGEGLYVLLMLGSIAVNYGLGLALGRAASVGHKQLVVTLSVGFNIGLLVTFKYAGFLAENIDLALTGLGMEPLSLRPMHLPIGVSFFTFQAMSYVIDVARGQAKVQRDPVDLALYIALFPQLIAGPIVRFRDVAEQLKDRVVTLELFASGVSRFVTGLAKKMLVANVVAIPADHVFGLGASELSPALAWMGVICYALQIYFDFSGYSDMAIGLGRMFGFRFLENFDHPYIARSVTEFWRRWHISLSSWFRDYLYIPLGGNRHGAARTYRNLVLVFLLCGLWHGAAWTFVVWGLMHGAFLVLERLGLGRALSAGPRALGHLWTLTVVLAAWVVFRAESLGGAGEVFAALTGATGVGAAELGSIVDARHLVALAAGVVGSMPVAAWLTARLEAWRASSSQPEVVLALTLGARNVVLAVLFLLSAAALSSGTHNPFIYFRF
jgi:alginate O-acetyltransferase complex protein AlgI